MHLIQAIELSAAGLSAPCEPVAEKYTLTIPDRIAQGRASCVRAFSFCLRVFVSLIAHAQDKMRGTMRVYALFDSAYHLPSTRVYERPGREPATDPAEFYDDAEKKKPTQFQIEFVYGEAEVPDALGKWLVANKRAKSSRIIMPAMTGSRVARSH